MKKQLKVKENIVLTGFMGTGKTSCGIIVAGKTWRKFVDTDTLIEQAAGKSVREIFEENGEKYFRRLERKIIAAVSAEKGLVIATGGGAVMSPANIRNLRKKGKIIALAADEKTILKRIFTKRLERPLVEAGTKKAVLHKIQKLLKARLPVYVTFADFVIDTSKLSPGATAKKVLCLLKAPRIK